MTQQEFLAIAKRISPFSKSGGDSQATPRSLRDEGRKAMLVGNLIIFLGLGVFVVWALFAPLAEGVPARGTVVVESLRKTVTHTTGGTIDVIHVKENQFVQAGEVLITLKAAKAKTAHETTLQEYIATSAKLARLNAEQVSANAVEFPDELYELADQNGKLDSIKAQQDLFLIRRQALASELAILQSNIQASGVQIAGLRQQISSKTTQLTSLTAELESSRSLVDSGYSSRNSYFDLERRVAELASVKAELETRIAREISTSAELRLRHLQRRQEFLRDVETQLAEVRGDALKLRGQLSDARIDLDSKVIRAPVAGQVVALQANTPDAAINPGTKILEIVPENETLLIDVQIPVQVINGIVVGEMADVRITAFPGDPQLVIEGIVQSVAEDVREAPPPGLPYYLGRIAVSPEGMKQLGARQLRPGMSVDVIIKTGERSLMTYLMRPILKQLFFAMKEH